MFAGLEEASDYAERPAGNMSSSNQTIVGICGAGTMGAKAAQALATNGVSVWAHDVCKPAVDALSRKEIQRAGSGCDDTAVMWRALKRTWAPGHRPDKSKEPIQK